jgi:hypothetical protein
MKQLFGPHWRSKAELEAEKAATENAVIAEPPPLTTSKGKKMRSPVELIADPNTRDAFIAYSVFDAEQTWRLYQARTRINCYYKIFLLFSNLFDNICFVGFFLLQKLVDMLKSRSWVEGTNTMMDFYSNYWRPFGQVLVDMELTGIHIDTKLFAVVSVALFPFIYSHISLL